MKSKFEASKNTTLKRHSSKIASTEKSTLWTDAGVDQNFQRDLGAIGPYEFQGKSAWTNRLVPCFFSGEICHDNGPESSSKFPPETGIVPQMALPSSSAISPLFYC